MAKILRTWTEAGGTLALREHAQPAPLPPRFDLVLGNVVLLSSAALETESAFGRLAETALAAGGAARVVVGGLGFGATLRGVLEVLPPDGRVLVVEKLRAVVDVARNEAAHLLAGALEDPRVVLLHEDVADVIAREADLSAVLLDVDNGPDFLIHPPNAGLYADPGLRSAFDRLRAGGLLAVWCQGPAPDLSAALTRLGDDPRDLGAAVAVRIVRALSGKVALDGDRLVVTLPV